ncbi:hypothetical protein ANO11243_031910 [Dothideomycetidae sp. 11243]|nr:hypothetical protein ANO11243_031910 [fungal sp. No.11243]
MTTSEIGGVEANFKANGKSHIDWNELEKFWASRDGGGDDDDDDDVDVVEEDNAGEDDADDDGDEDDDGNDECCQSRRERREWKHGTGRRQGK